MHYRRLYGAIALSLCALSVNSYARIKLISLPVREYIEIQLENKHTTIIEEERIVPLKKAAIVLTFPGRIRVLNLKPLFSECCWIRPL